MYYLCYLSMYVLHIHIHVFGFKPHVLFICFYIPHLLFKVRLDGTMLK